jgi:hypothetical protein
LLLFVAACGFQGPPLGTTSGDGGPTASDGPPSTIDAPTSHAIDAPVTNPTIDAPPPCNLVPSSTHTVVGHLGGTTGGQAAAAIACAGTGVPVGIEIAMTQAPLTNHNNETGVTNISVQCGTLTSTTTTLTEKINRVGSGATNCTQFNAPTDLGMMTCPQGTGIVAIDGNEVDTTLYNSIVVTCSDNTTHLAFSGSGAYTNQPEHVQCAAGSVFVGFNVREACGQDELEVLCAPLTCD